MFSPVGFRNGVGFNPVVNRMHPLISGKAAAVFFFSQTTPGTHKAGMVNLVSRRPGYAPVTATDQFGGMNGLPWAVGSGTSGSATPIYDGYNGIGMGNITEQDNQASYYGKHSCCAYFALARGGGSGGDYRIFRTASAPSFYAPAPTGTPPLAVSMTNNATYPDRLRDGDTQKSHFTCGGVVYPPYGHRANLNVAFYNGQALGQSNNSNSEASQNHLPFHFFTGTAAASLIMAISWLGYPPSDAEFASLHADPFQIFVRPPMLAGGSTMDMLSQQFVDPGLNPARYGDFNIAV